jgi:Pilin (bacterial filament)
MKQFLLTLAAVLIGGFLALLAYDHFIVKPREAGGVAAAASPPKTEPVPAHVDLSQARSEARQVAQEVEASVQRSVDSARDAMDAQAKEADRRSLIAGAVSQATMFRVTLTEYYQSNGAWPREAEDAGLPPSDDTRGPGVAGIALAERGAVVVSLDDAIAAGSKIVLRPSVNATTGMVDWRCELKGDPSLKAMLPRCEAVP